MLQLNGTTALESSHIAVSCKSNGIPESHRCLHTQLIFECSQRRIRVVCPITPGAASQAILRTEQHIDRIDCWNGTHFWFSSCFSPSVAVTNKIKQESNSTSSLRVCVEKIWLCCCKHRVTSQRCYAWKNMPIIAIIARRPFASSAFNRLVFVSGSLPEKIGGFHPMSPGVRLLMSAS